MFRFLKKIEDESAGVMVENVIVFPLVFVVIIFMIISAFLLYDRVVIETAARRGATYASHCVADPHYATLVGQSGDLDFSKSVESLNFSSVGKDIQPYRYLSGGMSVQSVVETEVKKIINKSRINWVPQENVTVLCTQENKIIYQDVCVKVTSTYNLPGWLDWFGLETKYKIETEARLAAVDPDEFIRNADLVVDIITSIDDATGNHVNGVLDKITNLGSKLINWLEME